MGNVVVFPLSVLCFWIKGSFLIANNTLVVDRMNTVLGVIPAGREVRSIPLQNVSACIVDRSYDLQSLFVGLMMLFAGGYGFGKFPILAVILLILGVSAVLGAIRTTVCIQNNGTEMAVFIPFYAAEKAYLIKNMVDNAIKTEGTGTAAN